MIMTMTTAKTTTTTMMMMIKVVVVAMIILPQAYTRLRLFIQVANEDQNSFNDEDDIGNWW